MSAVGDLAMARTKNRGNTFYVGYTDQHLLVFNESCLPDVLQYATSRVRMFRSKAPSSMKYKAPPVYPS
jgi:hypothetical protein